MSEASLPKDPDELIHTYVSALSSLGYHDRIKCLRSWQIRRFLYKFRAPPSETNTVLEHIFLRSQLWLSSPSDFNDPFDMAAKIIVDSTPQERRKRFDELLKNSGVNWAERQRRIRGIFAKFSLDKLAELAQMQSQKQTERTGVCSFGGDPLSILMWSHYTSNHQGVCLQFDVARDPNAFLFALPVEYSDEYPVVNWVTGFHGKDVADTLLRKHSGWSYERESRIIRLEEARRPYSFRPEALKAVIIGCRAKEKPIFELIDKRVSTGLPKPVLYEAIQHDRKYRLLLKRL